MDEESRYRYEERLALLGVINRDPQPQERRMALQDVEEYRQAIANQNQTNNNSLTKLWEM